MMRHHTTSYRNNRLNDDVEAKIQLFKEVEFYIKKNMTTIDTYGKIAEDHNLDISDRAVYMQSS